MEINISVGVFRRMYAWKVAVDVFGSRYLKYGSKRTVRMRWSLVVATPGNVTWLSSVG